MCMCVCVCVCVCTRSVCPTLYTKCPTLCDPTDCSLPCSTAHGIFQARILGCVTISCSRGSFDLRIELHLLHLLHWQAHSLPLHHLGSLYMLSYRFTIYIIHIYIYIYIYFLKYSVPLTSLSPCFLRVPFTYLHTDFWPHVQAPLSSALLHWCSSRLCPTQLSSPITQQFRSHSWPVYYTAYLTILLAHTMGTLHVQN